MDRDVLLEYSTCESALQGDDATALFLVVSGDHLDVVDAPCVIDDFTKDDQCVEIVGTPTKANAQTIQPDVARTLEDHGAYIPVDLGYIIGRFRKTTGKDVWLLDQVTGLHLGMQAHLNERPWLGTECGLKAVVDLYNGLGNESLLLLNEYEVIEYWCQVVVGVDDVCPFGDCIRCSIMNFL